MNRITIVQTHQTIMTVSNGGEKCASCGHTHSSGELYVNSVIVDVVNGWTSVFFCLRCWVRLDPFRTIKEIVNNA